MPFIDEAMACSRLLYSLSRDGTPASGPLWMDSFEVGPGEVEWKRRPGTWRPPTGAVSGGHAPSHVLKVHRILSRALKIAHRRRLIVENVASEGNS